MEPLGAIENRVRRWLFGRDFVLWHDPRYRLPLPGLEARTGVDARRPDFAAWFLLERGALAPGRVRKPARIAYEDMARVHTPELLESLDRPETLARIFSVDPGDIRPDEVLTAVRLACGGTLQAARSCLRPRARGVARRELNLSGGFHHAGRARNGGFSPVNDVAIAVAALRHEGFRGQVAVLDLDAHPPDGTADCLRGDGQVWIGSISGADWGPLPGVDETVLPEGASDAEYLGALDALLGRMPEAGLAFVLAGGDVLAGDALGRLALSLDGARERDLRVADALFRVPSVWLPAGGYGPDAWKLLAGTGLALATRSRAKVPAGYDPLARRYSRIAARLTPAELGPPAGEDELLLAELGQRSARPLLLGFYSAEGLELALSRYGLLGELRRLGYGPFRVTVSNEAVGDRARLYGSDESGAEHLLIECVLEKREVAGEPVLYVHWLTLRHPLARFSAQRPPLPDQQVPGLGLAREMATLFALMAERLGLAGVAFRPAAFHTAYAGRAQLRFVDPVRQGRFEALVRDLAGVPLAAATAAVASGQVLMGGQPYRWEPDEMVLWRSPHAQDAEAVAAAREAAHFTVRG
ncbi:MAG TPA: histone deacetylase [Myxococcales bacterium]|nr:histone deacetylase [Myxococcales bacterium]